MSELRVPDLAARLWAGGAPRDDLVTRVCDALRAQIADHALPAGTRLPSEARLARELNISRPTLREATRILARDGLLDVRHGVGTFVAAGSPHLRNALDSMSSLSATIRAAGRVAGVRALSIESVSAAYEVAQALETPTGTQVARITRVRLVDGAPLALAAEYLPLGGAVSFDRLAAFSGASLYEYLTRDLGLALLRSEVSVTAVAATVRQAKALSIKSGAPLLQMREIHFGEGGRRILYSINHHNSAVIDLTLARVGVRALTGFCAIGNLSIDDLVFVDGATQWAVPGGNAVYSALGMAVWGERPIVVAPYGPDYPVAPLEARIDLSGPPRLDRTLRDWGLYEEDGSRQFIFRSTTRNWDEFSPTARDIAPGAPFAHLAPLPWHRHVELVAALRATGTRIISVDLDDRRLAEVARADVVRLMASVDLFLPSRQDGRVIVPDASAADTVRRLRDMSPGTPLIVLKCGADGCIAHAKDSSDLLFVPAARVDAKDATGAGDTFCGGALVGYSRAKNPLEALLHGAVSASFCIATVGVQGLLEADVGEAELRRAALENAARTQAF